MTGRGSEAEALGLTPEGTHPRPATPTEGPCLAIPHQTTGRSDWTWPGEVEPGPGVGRRAKRASAPAGRESQESSDAQRLPAGGRVSPPAKSQHGQPDRSGSAEKSPRQGRLTTTCT